MTEDEDRILREQREIKVSALIASFAREGEILLTNDEYGPKDTKGWTTREILERKMREAHPDMDFRFYYEHIVAFSPIVMDGRMLLKIFGDILMEKQYLSMQNLILCNLLQLLLRNKLLRII